MNFLVQIISFLATWALLYLVTRYVPHFFQDQPNERSLHVKPIPRSGGLCMMIVWLLTNIFVTDKSPLLIFPAVLMLISLLDDWRGVPVVLRFMGHFLVAIAFCLTFFPDMRWFCLTISVFAIVWMTNLYNFMDGSDGLAGGMALLGFSAYGAIALWAGDYQLATLSFSLVAASAAFLIFNFHPAKIFMGDAGSIPIGFLAATIGLVGWQKHIWPIWYPFLVFSPFIVDATVTLCRRGLRGDKVWQAHKEHYYQRLVQMGVGHRNTAILEYLLMLLCIITGVMLLKASYLIQWTTLLGLICIYIILMFLIDRRWLKKRW